MAAELTTHQSRNGEWSFRLRSSDGRILASGGGYPTKEDMKRGIEEARAVLRFTETDRNARDPSVEQHKPRPPTERNAGRPGDIDVLICRM